MKIIPLLLILFLLSCSHSNLIEDNINYSEARSLQLGVSKLKDNGDAYQANLFVKNTSKSDVLIFVHDLQCFKKDSVGIFQFLDDPDKNRFNIHLKLGEEKSFPINCELSATPQEQNFVIKLTKVYENPSGDGRTLGKILDKNLEWAFKK